jgi:hypothetical protein
MRLRRQIVTPKFSIDQRVFNRKTEGKGTVGRVYESHGVTMYEVRIPIEPQGHSIGSNISDWAEDVLDLEQGHSRF